MKKVVNHARTVGILVARMGSMRVPGKTLLDVCGRPLLWYVIEAARQIRGLDDLCIATSVLEQDDPIADLAAAHGVECTRGEAERLLDRVHAAARAMRARVVVHLQGDCPFIDPDILRDAVEHFRANPCDYLCNYDPPTFPEGMDVNIVRWQALDRAHREALAPSQRVHPFSYLTRHPESFDIQNYAMSPDLSTYHWSLDFPEDVEFIRAVYEKLYQPGSVIGLHDVLALIERDERIRELNEKLKKPKVLHAFWNSPGIIRDMNDDVVALCSRGREALEGGDSALAGRCYEELLRIAGELHRKARHQQCR